MKVEFDLRTPCYVLSTITHSKVPAEMGSAASKARKYPEAVSKVVENGVKGPSATANKMALNRLAESHKSDGELLLGHFIAESSSPTFAFKQLSKEMRLTLIFLII